MNHAAEFGLSRSTPERIDFLQAENLFGIDCIGVAPQGLDLGDAQSLWTQFERRPRQGSSDWRRNHAGTIDLSREVQVKIATLPASLPRLAAKRCHALKKPRRHRGSPVPFAGPAQDHFSLAHGLGKIMRCLAELALGRAQAQSGAHGPVEKSIAARLRRPNRLIEAAEQNDIGIDQPRLEEAQNLEARMRLRL